MEKKTVEELLEQAVCEGIIEVQCPECLASVVSEPDAEELGRSLSVLPEF